jgi:hypothetical protein
MITSCLILLRLRNVHTNIVQKIDKHIAFSIIFFLKKSYHLRDNVKKYCCAGLATNDNVVHAHFMLDT